MTIRYVAEQLGVSLTLARRYLMLWENRLDACGTASLSCLESLRNFPVLENGTVAPPRFQF